nr:immunoglobulin light chain junction region [Mus musculus]NSM00913.1 immunoglobulin light chain junction region [Mus musculus]
CQNSRELLTF